MEVTVEHFFLQKKHIGIMNRSFFSLHRISAPFEDNYFY